MGLFSTIIAIPFIFFALYMLGVKSDSVAYKVVIGAVVMYLAWVVGLKDIVRDLKR